MIVIMESLQNWSPYLKKYDPLKAGSIDGTDKIPHDNAIYRAMHSCYEPNRKLKSDPYCTIFVARLNKNTDEKVLTEVFKKYGHIKSCTLVRDIVTGTSKCYAFIEYKNRNDAKNAYHRANKLEIDNNIIFVDFECGRTMPGWIPRRLGGGFGGKKESGQLRFGGRDKPFKKPIIIHHRMNSRI